MWVLLYRALYYTVYWSDKGIVLLLFSLFASAGDLTDFLNWFFSAFCLAVQRLDIFFFFKSFRKGLFMISVHKTIVEIQNPEIISVCGLGCSINFWVHVRYNEAWTVDFLLPRSPSYSQTWVIWHLSINPCADSNSDHWNTFKHVSMHSKTFLRGCISTLYT